MNSRTSRLLASAVLAITGFVATLPSHAATVTYSTVRTGPLTNVDDAEGRWQFSGGKVYLGRTHVGYFIRKKRVSFALSGLVNKGSVETTVMWKWGRHAMTLQGSHNFSSGKQVGGVSATSAGFSAYEGGSYTGSPAEFSITF